MPSLWDLLIKYGGSMVAAREDITLTNEELAIAKVKLENPPIFGEEPSESAPVLWKYFFEDNGFPRTIIPNMDTVGNFMVFGPLGKYSKYGTLLIAMVAARYTNTPKGQQLLAQVVIEYLKSMAKVVSSMQPASAANWLNALMNQRTTINMLARVGLISPYDQFSESVWLDHVLAEMLKLSYTQETIGSLTTLVTGATYERSAEIGREGAEASESGAGLAALAKILAGK